MDDKYRIVNSFIVVGDSRRSVATVRLTGNYSGSLIQILSLAPGRISESWKTTTPLCI